MRFEANFFLSSSLVSLFISTSLFPSINLARSYSHGMVNIIKLHFLHGVHSDGETHHCVKKKKKTPQPTKRRTYWHERVMQMPDAFLDQLAHVYQTEKWLLLPPSLPMSLTCNRCTATARPCSASTTAPATVLCTWSAIHGCCWSHLGVVGEVPSKPSGRLFQLTHITLRRLPPSIIEHKPSHAHVSFNQRAACTH